MPLTRLVHRDVLALSAPLEEVWAFFSTAQNLAVLTPPAQRLRVGRGGDRTVVPGLEVDISVSPVPLVRTRWKTRIETVVTPEAGHPDGAWFTDVQLNGPFALWHHLHALRSTPEGGVVVMDHVHYALPLGALGRAVAGRWVRGQVAALFAYRKVGLERLFGAAAIPEGWEEGWTVESATS